MITEFSQIEKEMMNFNFEELEKQTIVAKSNLVEVKSVSDVKLELCKVWSKIRKFIKYGENIPYIGKFIRILSDLLDTLCDS